MNEHVQPFMNPNHPAFPRQSEIVSGGRTAGIEPASGITVRAWIATHCIAGMLSNTALHDAPAEKAAVWAAECADALIAELNREPYAPTPE